MLPWGTAGVAVAVAADGSWLLDVGAEHPVNHFAISLPPAAEPGVLFAWRAEIAVSTGAFATDRRSDSDQLLYLLHRVWSNGTTSSVPTRRRWPPPAPCWTPGRCGVGPGWCTYRTLLPWSRREDGPDAQRKSKMVAVAHLLT